MTKISPKKLQNIFSKSKNKKIAIIGDVMVDKYVYGEINRVSPEAPVPVIDVKKIEYKLGGAANVANNVKALGSEPILIGLIGDDLDGKNFLLTIKSLKLNASGIVNDKTRPTTTKTRVIAHSQHVIRIDDEKKKDVSGDAEKKVLDFVRKNISSFEAVILQDYNKGILSKKMINQVIALCKKNNKPVYVDPKFDNFFEYKGVNVFKPNKKEIQDVLGMKVDDDESAAKAGKKLLEKLECEYLVLTRGEKGMMLFDKENGKTVALSIPTKARNVADVSGAGDTVISTIAVTLAGGAGIEEAIVLANHAAGIVCEEVGIVPIYRKALINSFAE